MECKLCLQSNKDLFELQSEEGMKRQALDLLQYHFSFCFTVTKPLFNISHIDLELQYLFSLYIQDNSQGGRVCRQCWNNVDQFHTFYLQIQDIHVHMTSVKSETESIDESGPVIVKVEAATDESTADYDSETDMKLTTVWLDEETAFDTHSDHSEEEANSIQGKRAERKASTASERSEESNVSIELQSDEPPKDSDSDWIPEEPLVPKCPICGKEFSNNSILKVIILFYKFDIELIYLIVSIICVEISLDAHSYS